MIHESQHTFIEYKTIKEVIDTGTLIMMLTKAGAVLYFEKKNATKSQYEGIRKIFEKKKFYPIFLRSTRDMRHERYR